MPSKKKLGFNDYSFRSVFLNEREKTDFTSWIEERKTTIPDALEKFCESSVKVSYSYDYKQDCNQIAITFRNDKLAAHGIVYMFRNRNLLRLTQIAYYYVSEVLDWGNLDEEPVSELDF